MVLLVVVTEIDVTATIFSIFLNPDFNPLFIRPVVCVVKKRMHTVILNFKYLIKPIVQRITCRFPAVYKY